MMKITIEDDILMVAIDDEAALLNPKNGRYFSLNATGVRVWSLLTQTSSAEKILRMMLTEYNVAEDVLEQDLQRLFHQLAEAELVRVS